MLNQIENRESSQLGWSMEYNSNRSEGTEYIVLSQSFYARKRILSVNPRNHGRSLSTKEARVFQQKGQGLHNKKGKVRGRE